MNSDQIKGKAKDIVGKVQEKVGEAIDSDSQRAKGVGKQVEGKVQEKVGDTRERLDDTRDRG